MPPTLTVSLRLRENAFRTFVEAIGEEAYRASNGARLTEPNKTVLFGSKNNGKATRVLNHEHVPDNKTVATIATRYAVAAGVGFWAACEALFEPVVELVEAGELPAIPGINSPAPQDSDAPEPQAAVAA
jgi:hypothetical protein